MPAILTVILLLLVGMLIFGLVNPVKHAELIKRNWGRGKTTLWYGLGIVGALALMASGGTRRPAGIAHKRLAAVVHSAAAVAGYRIYEEDQIPGGVRALVVVDHPTARKLEAITGNFTSFKMADVSFFDTSRAARDRKAVLASRASKATDAYYDRHFVGEYSRNGSTGYSGLSITLQGDQGPMQHVKI